LHKDMTGERLRQGADAVGALEVLDDAPRQPGVPVQALYRNPAMLLAPRRS
jgi:hypothetical protein